MSAIVPWSLAGRVALVTGAGVGIGRATALALAQAGAAVGVHYHTSEAGARQTAETIREAGGTAHLLPADLTDLVAHRPSVLYWILQPGSTIGGVGMGVVRMVRPWNEWLLIWGYDIDGPEPQIDEAQARAIAHRLIGDDSVDVKVRDISLWTNNAAYMTRYSSGRVF